MIQDYLVHEDYSAREICLATLDATSKKERTKQ